MTISRRITMLAGFSMLLRVGSAVAEQGTRIEPYGPPPPAVKPGSDLGSAGMETGRLDDRTTPVSLERNTIKAVTYSTALHAVMIGTLMLFPPENWHGGNAPRSAQFQKSWTGPPTFHDGDPWTTNFVAHPIMGAYFYGFARTNGYAAPAAFLFSTANSLVWEYGIESWFEQPSAVDMLVTSTAGSLIGEGMWLLRNQVMKGGVHGFGEYVAIALLDPITFFDLAFS